MANDSHSVGFFAAEALARTSRRQPEKTALIAKDEKLTFSALNQQVEALAGHLQREGVGQGDRVGVLLPNSMALPLSYYATQKIGAVTVILDVRLRGKELQSVLADAALKLLIVHGQLLAEVQEILQMIHPLAVWVVNGDDDRSFEKRLAPTTARASSPTPSSWCSAAPSW